MARHRNRITGIRVSNYRSIGRNQELKLGPLTVLVGRNGSGKSSVVDALSFVRDAMHKGLATAIVSRGGIESVRRKGAGRPHTVSIHLSVELESGPGSYEFEIAANRKEEYRVKSESARVCLGDGVQCFRVNEGSWRGPEGLDPRIGDTELVLPAVAGDDRFRPLFELISRVLIYAIFPDRLRKPCKPDPEKPMHRHGDNWVSILRNQEASTWKPELIAGLKYLIGDVSDIRVTRAANLLVAQFRHGENGHGKWFDAARESDGTLRVAGILTALLQEPPLPLVGIEEPELKVHPGAFAMLMDYLRQASDISRVLLTSHSPELLDLVEADEVRVLTRANGETRIRPMAEHQQDVVRSRLLTLGELMTTEGLAPQG